MSDTAAATRTPAPYAAAIAASLEIAGGRADDLSARVYGILFERAPEMQALFWRDTRDAIKGEMLMKVFEAILDFIGERNYADNLIRSEAQNHEGYEVPRDVFATFFGIVAEVVREACGADWTNTMADAWSHTLIELDSYVSHTVSCTVSRPGAMAL